MVSDCRRSLDKRLAMPFITAMHSLAVCHWSFAIHDPEGR